MLLWFITQPGYTDTAILCTKKVGAGLYYRPQGSKFFSETLFQLNFSSGGPQQKKKLPPIGGSAILLHTESTTLNLYIPSCIILNRCSSSHIPVATRNLPPAGQPLNQLASPAAINAKPARKRDSLIISFRVFIIALRLIALLLYNYRIFWFVKKEVFFKG